MAKEKQQNDYAQVPKTVLARIVNELQDCSKEMKEYQDRDDICGFDCCIDETRKIIRRICMRINKYLKAS